jgi:hypothetical protein
VLVAVLHRGRFMKYPDGPSSGPLSWAPAV